jgi:hypothetical protein
MQRLESEKEFFGNLLTTGAVGDHTYRRRAWPRLKEFDQLDREAWEPAGRSQGNIPGFFV